MNEEYGSCYKIGVSVLARDWYQARLACQSFGAELASIKDTGDRDYLINFVNNNAMNTSSVNNTTFSGKVKIIFLFFNFR